MATIIGLGATLTYGDDGITYGSTVSTITEISVPEVECSDVETTHLGVSNATKTFIPGLIDGGELEVTTQFDKTQHAALYTLIRTSKYWKLTVDDATTDSALTFQGYVKKVVGPTVDGVEDIVMGKYTIKVTTKPTFTAGS